METINKEIEEVVHDGILRIINDEIQHLPNIYSWETIFWKINPDIQRIRFVLPNN